MGVREVRLTDEQDILVLASPASERLLEVARSQLDRLELVEGDLIHRPRGPDEAAVAALELRRWAAALPETDSRVGIGIAPAGPAAAPAEDARVLARGATGEVRVAAPLAGEIETSWARARGRGKGRRLTWTPGGGSATSIPSARVNRLPMLGRREEMAAIADAWDRVSAGGRRVILIEGGPGSGKSRLIDEAIGEIDRAGGAVRRGSGQGADSRPYEAIVTALDAGLDAALDGDSTLPPSAGVGNEPATMFATALEELERLASEGPVVLAIDDLQLCDLGSLRLLAHLATSASLEGLLVLCTTRTGEPDPDSAHAAAIAPLRAVAEAPIELANLDRAAIEGLAGAAGVPAGEARAIATRVHEETDGLAFYATELIRELATDADGPPSSLRRLIARRAGALERGALEHIQVAAAAGEGFDATLIARACEAEVTEVERSLRQAVAGGLIREAEAPGTFEFEHELTVRHLIDDLDAETAERLHGALGRARAELTAEGRLDPDPAATATHFRRAGPGSEAQASLWAGRAGAAALARHSPDAAVRWYRRALGTGPEPGAAERCDQLTGYGAALRMSGDPEFRDVLLEAARLALELEDTDRLVGAVLTNDRGFTSAVGRYDTDRLEMLERAAERVSQPSHRALVLAQLALELTFAPQQARRHDLAAEALDIARDLDDSPLLARVSNRALIARWQPGNARERISLADESLRAGGEHPSLDLFHAHHWRGIAQLEDCEIDGFAASASAEAEVAARIGDATAMWLSEVSSSLAASLAGDLGAAERRAERASRLGIDSSQPDSLPFFVSQLAAIRWQQGRLGELSELLDEALRLNPGLPVFRSLVCLARTAGDDRDAAAELLAEDRLSAFGELPRDPTWLAGVVTYSHAAAELEDAEAAAVLTELLEPMRGRLATTSVSCWGLVDHALGRLALTMGLSERAEVNLERAWAEYGRMGMPVWQGQAGVDLAIALRAADRRPGRVAELVDLARGTAIKHGARLLLRSLPPRPRGSRPPAGPPGIAATLSERLASLDLTDRQRDIIALVVRGQSNKQVAEELEISPKTVKRHLEEAFSRTGVRGRKGLMALLTE